MIIDRNYLLFPFIAVRVPRNSYLLTSNGSYLSRAPIIIYTNAPVFPFELFILNKYDFLKLLTELRGKRM